MALNAKDMGEFEKHLEEEKKKEEVRLARAQMTVSQGYKVYHGGPLPKPKMGKIYDEKDPKDRSYAWSYGWNLGDIDFDEDGSIFIRNPYLANAIERCLQANYEKWVAWKTKAERNVKEGGSDEPFLFRLTRDEGWSGPKQNMVC